MSPFLKYGAQDGSGAFANESATAIYRSNLSGAPNGMLAGSIRFGHSQARTFPYREPYVDWYT